MTLEEQKRRGIEAAQIKSSKLLNEAFETVRFWLDSKALNTPTTDTDACRDIIRTRQLLSGVERAFESMINNGKIAEKELERLMKEPKKKIFSRY